MIRVYHKILIYVSFKLERSQSLSPKPKLLQRSQFFNEIISRTGLQGTYQKPEENTAGIQVNAGKFRCIECVKVVPVFSSDEIEAGDHIVFFGAVYDHHAIITAKLQHGKSFEITEATNTVTGAVLGILKILRSKATILSSTKKIEFTKQKICVVVYKRRFSKEETVRRALDFCKEAKNGKYEYDLFGNNCEHFATYCVTGQTFSVQVLKIKLTLDLFFNSALEKEKSGKYGYDLFFNNCEDLTYCVTGQTFAISDELKRNEKEYKYDLICRECLEMNKNLLQVKAIPITSDEYVQQGDIIRYLYLELTHDAVVLDKRHDQSTKNAVVCSIAHYAFCGVGSHRTIKKENKVIELDGSCLKLDYCPPSYEVYSPEEVVNRAKQRIGEQWFVFFSNDSSHFARWCKLRLWRS